MANTLLTFEKNRKNIITLWVVMKRDGATWFIGAAGALLVFAGVVALIRGVMPGSDGSFLNASAALYSWAMPLYWVLVGVACLLARRSRDMWTWVLTVVLIIFFIPQGAVTLAMHLLPNSILPALIAMIGLLSAGRLVEYVRMRYIVGLKEPRLSWLGVLFYIVLIIGTIIMDTPFVAVAIGM